jgi:SH3-like domain-containing protein
MITLLVILIAALLFTLPLSAQVSPTPPNPNANISWPPPVYTVSGNFTLRGSANLPNQSNYFIEYQPIVEFSDDQTIDPAIWFPATAPSASAVQDGVLGVWDTTLTDDGVYQLRLTVRVRGGQPVTAQVGPVRVLNNPPPFAISEGPAGVATQPPAVQITAQPTLDINPRVTVTRSSVNVRQGDSVNYPVITALTQGTTVAVLGISNQGTGWYYVQLPDGRRGWISPSVVNAEGDFSNIPRLAPPPIPVTPTPVPTFTPATVTNLTAGIVVFDNPTPTCNVPFTVGFDIANTGSVPTNGGIVTLTDSRQADGAVQATIQQPIPFINPGTTIRVNFPITMSTFYNEVHVITLVIDSTNQFIEFNENDNRQTVTYVLQRGGCP